MIDKDFNALLTAVAEAFDVSKSEILKKRSLGASKARQFMCHVIYHGLPHLRSRFLEKADMSKTGYYKSSRSADATIKSSVDDLCRMNEIRVRVGLPRLKNIEEDGHRISNTKKLFGFDYTESDVIRRRTSIQSANEYMRKMCSIGRQPIPDGMVFSVNGKKDCIKLYND